MGGSSGLAKTIVVALTSMFVQVAGIIYAKGRNINIVSTDFAELAKTILMQIPIIGNYIGTLSVEIMVAILSYLIIFIVVSFFFFVFKGALGWFLALLAGFVIAFILLGIIKIPIAINIPRAGS